MQLLPYKLNYKGAFQSVARENRVHYLEWALTDPTKVTIIQHALSLFNTTKVTATPISLLPTDPDPGHGHTVM